MSPSDILLDPDAFSEALYERLKHLNPGIDDLELYEFRYALDNLFPQNDGWASVKLDSIETLQQRIHSADFYTHIQLRPHAGDKIVLDENVLLLTNQLFVGLVTGEYPEAWVNAHFYFDIRGFLFLTRTLYFTDKVLAHLGGKPFKSFEQKQKRFERRQDIGYKEFKEANTEVDQAFVESVMKLIAVKGTPILLALAGPTAAGKTEIVARLRSSLLQTGQKVTSIETDNFMTDRSYREEKGINSMGKEAFHFELFLQSLERILDGQKVTIPQYVQGASSHDLNGNLKAGYTPLEIEPADIVFVEGNFQFQIPEIRHLIGVKIVYLTDDPIRLKRKWKRDIDYRNKYDPAYFRNRFFRTQFLRAQESFLHQMEVCDLVVDTTGAALWVTPEIAKTLRFG
jgi:uridine kinase